MVTLDNGVIGNIRQQIGEILGTVKSISEALRDHREERIRQEQRLTQEIANLKQEQRQFDTLINARLELLARQFSELDEKARIITSEVGGLKKDVAELGGLKEPVKEFADFRKRAMAYLVVMGSVAALIWTVLTPFINTVIGNLFGKGH